LWGRRGETPLRDPTSCNPIKRSAANLMHDLNTSKHMDGEIEQGNIKLSHLNVFDIYVIDYAGTITFDKGLSNMDIIENKLRELSLNRVCLKIIFDLSNTIWENRETHDALSKIARKIFNPHNFDFVIYTAIVNNEIVGPAFENEHWFINKDDAIKWLAEKT
jgi:hypothetical protein